MSTTRVLKRAFTQPETLVWRRMTRADCAAPRGRIPWSSRRDRLLDELFVISAWGIPGENVSGRKPLGRGRPFRLLQSATARAPPEIAPPSPPPSPRPPPRPPQRFENRYPDVQCEERIVGDRFPVGFRIYHPNQTQPLRANIFYIPPPSHFLFQPEKVISLLSYMTAATIITPLPPDTPKLFPQSLHDLLRIYDHWTGANAAQTAILTAGTAAPLATSIALTEKAVRALGVWGGVLDLTVNAENATAWNRTDERWDHYPPPPPPPPPPPCTAAVEPPVLAIPEAQYWESRKHAFPDPESWPDPFASPQLLFRSAPVEFSRFTLREIWGRNALADWDRDKMLEEAEVLKAQARGEDANATLIRPRRQPRYFQDFPPANRGAPFPRVRLVLPEGADDDVVGPQGLAFAEVVRSSVVRWFHLYRRDIHQDDAAEIAESKVLLNTFGTDDVWEGEVKNMGHWLRWALDNEQEY